VRAALREHGITDDVGRSKPSGGLLRSRACSSTAPSQDECRPAVRWACWTSAPCSGPSFVFATISSRWSSAGTDDVRAARRRPTVSVPAVV